MRKERVNRILGLLEKSVEILSRDGGWTQGAMARTSEGREVETNDPNAVSFCSSGVLRRARIELSHNDDHALSEVWEAERQLGLVMVSSSHPEPELNVVRFNDTVGRVKWEVIEAFQDAIEKLKEAKNG